MQKSPHYLKTQVYILFFTSIYFYLFRLTLLSKVTFTPKVYKKIYKLYELTEEQVFSKTLNSPTDLKHDGKYKCTKNEETTLTKHKEWSKG